MQAYPPPGNTGQGKAPHVLFTDIGLGDLIALDEVEQHMVTTPEQSRAYVNDLCRSTRRPK